MTAIENITSDDLRYGHLCEATVRGKATPVGILRREGSKFFVLNLHTRRHRRVQRLARVLDRDSAIEMLVGLGNETAAARLADAETYAGDELRIDFGMHDGLCEACELRDRVDGQFVRGIECCSACADSAPDAEVWPAATQPKPSPKPRKKATTRKPSKRQPAKKNAKPAEQMSQLDAALAVLRKSRKPLSAKELVAKMAERKLWVSPNGKTPDATLAAAINREIHAKGSAARFAKPEPGRFAINKAAK